MIELVLLGFAFIVLALGLEALDLLNKIQKTLKKMEEALEFQVGEEKE